MDDVAIVTFTHTNVKDIWNMHYGQLKKFLPYIENKYIFCNCDSVAIENVCCIKYDDNDPFYKKYCDCLSLVKEEIILTMHEDNIMFDSCDIYDFYRFINFLKNEPYSFLRLIKSGIDRIEHIKEDFYVVPKESQYLYSMQPSLWKKNDLLEIINESKIKYIYNEPHVSSSIIILNKLGAYVYNNEPKAGRNHYWSYKFPVVEVLSKGKWCLSESGEKIYPLLNEYNINPQIRGYL